jgi:FkbM family methyltransferase
MAMQSSQLQVNTGRNPVYVRRGNYDGFWSDYGSGIWESDTRIVFSRFIDPQHSYIDIGAWIGPTLLLGCQLAKRAYGIEPDPIAYTELVNNINYNLPLTSNVQLFNICITSISGRIKFGSRGNGGDSMSSLLFSDEKTSWMVDGLNFQEWIEQNKINDCNFIKIDIEGGEYSVLPTMVAYLRNHRPTLLLSLHPCFLGELAGQSVRARLKRSTLRLGNTIRLLKMLKFYKYLYDPSGKIPRVGMSSSLRSRLHLRHRLAKVSLKPAVLLLVCLLSISGHTSALVLTDTKW